MSRRLLLAASILVFGLSAAAAAAGSGTDEHQDLKADFLRQGLQAQAGAKAFDSPGNWTVGGFLGVGTQNPERAVHLQDHNAVFRMDRDVDSAAFLLTRTAPNFNTVWKTYVVGVNADGPGDGSFVINDLGMALGGGGARRLTIDNDGNFGFNTSFPLAEVHIQDTGALLNLLALVSGGAAVMRVDVTGGLFLDDDRLQILTSSTSPGGFALATTSSFFADLGAGPGEEAFLALNGANALIVSPGLGDLGLLSIYDRDSSDLNYTFTDNGILLRGGGGSKRIQASEQAATEVMQIRTVGDEIWFVSNDTGAIRGQSEAFRWFVGGSPGFPRGAATLMELTANRRTLGGFGNLEIAGSLSEFSSFDLAEGFWKSGAAIEAGDVVRVDPHDPKAIVRAEVAEDRAVLGVISTAPGIVMGAGAFSVQQLREAWGEDAVGVFTSERDELYEAALARHEDLLLRSEELASLDTYVAARRLDFNKVAVNPEEETRLRAQFEEQLAILQNDLESTALGLFFERHVAHVALAGRVPVKVDAAYGAIEVGDLLVASPTAGHAMRANKAAPAPGTVLGKALEPLDAGTGMIMMLVMLR